MDGDGCVGTVLPRGSWDAGAAKGGAVLGLLGQVLDEVPSLVPMSRARLTADLVRPVPIGRRLHVVPTIRREGKKIQVVELQLLDGDVEHVRVTALRLRDADLSSRADVPASTTDHSPADALPPIEDSLPIGGLMPSPPGFMRPLDLRRPPRPHRPSAGPPITALRLRDADLSSREDGPASTTDHSPADALTPIEDSVPIGGLMPSPPGFMRSIDMRRAERSDGQSAGTWIRLMVPIVAGEPVSDGGRMAYAFDFANLIGMGQHIGRMSRSEEHTSELQSLMRISYAVFCLNKK